MTAVLGQFALLLALGMALFQVSLPLLSKKYVSVLGWVRPVVHAHALFIAVAFASLAYAFLTNDFSIVYVAKNSNTHLPALYRFCAIWGAHEGSLLLWVMLLGVWSSAVALTCRQLPAATLSHVCAVLGFISVGFLVFLFFTSNPFVTFLDGYPAQGRDLNPLLQDPGLVSHPPMLYMGYVGFAVAFAFAITALLEKRFDREWATWIRPWSLSAWAFLTLGITLGSWWAYRQLGWGGWWFWDPVENASLMPWLAGTALIHATVATEKRQVFKAWTVLLAIVTFALSLLGTFIVRSGVLISVHAFAVDPARGVFVLAFLGIVIGGAFGLYAWRAHEIKDEGRFSFWSRETMLLLNTILFVVVLGTVLLGTMYPLIAQALGWGKLSVGAPYFNKVVGPLMVPLLFLMGAGPTFKWSHTENWAKKLRLPFVISLILGVGLPILLMKSVTLSVMLAVGLAVWIGWLTIRKMIAQLTLSNWGMGVAHLGVAVCMLGIVWSSAYSVERDVRMSPGERVKVGQYVFTLEGISAAKGSNYFGAKAHVRVERGAWSNTLTPQLRYFVASHMTLPKAAIDASVTRDLYVVLAAPLEGKAWALRLYDKPLVRWIWVGGIMMLLGGGLAVIGRRRQRLGVPRVEK